MVSLVGWVDWLAYLVGWFTWLVGWLAGWRFGSFWLHGQMVRALIGRFFRPRVAKYSGSFFVCIYLCHSCPLHSAPPPSSFPPSSRLPVLLPRVPVPSREAARNRASCRDTVVFIRDRAPSIPSGPAAPRGDAIWKLSPGRLKHTQAGLTSTQPGKKL